jgi:hypothetical protein
MPAPKPVRIHQVAKKVAPKVAAKHSNPNSDPEIDAESEKIKKMKFSVGLDFNDRRIISNARSQMSEMAMDRNDEIASGEINYLNDPDRVQRYSDEYVANSAKSTNKTQEITSSDNSISGIKPSPFSFFSQFGTVEKAALTLRIHGCRIKVTFCISKSSKRCCLWSC